MKETKSENIICNAWCFLTKLLIILFTDGGWDNQTSEQKTFAIVFELQDARITVMFYLDSKVDRILHPQSHRIPSRTQHEQFSYQLTHKESKF